MGQTVVAAIVGFFVNVIVLILLPLTIKNVRE